MLSPKCVSKLDQLKGILQKTQGCAVAYSGGVDSSLLLVVAYEVLGGRCLAIIAMSSTYSQREYEAALQFVKEQRIPYLTICSEELDIPGFLENPPDRCYHCKKELFEKVRKQATAHGLKHIVDGTNADDLKDFRPGISAAQELGVLSPLKDAGLTKTEIRLIAREVYHLPMADKPAMACLASRFPYASNITRENLIQVEKIEAFLSDTGFKIYRARHHGQLLRIELGQEEMSIIINPEIRNATVKLAKEVGFRYVTLDLQGYRTGSMNEVIETKTLKNVPEATSNPS